MALENTQLDSQAIIPSSLKELTDAHYGSLIMKESLVIIWRLPNV